MTAAINRHAPDEHAPDEPPAEERAASLTRAHGASEAAREPAQANVDDVRPRGDTAPADYPHQLDGAHTNSTDPPAPAPAPEPEAEFEAAEGPVPATLRKAVGPAAENNRAHQPAYPPPNNWTHAHTPEAVSAERMLPTASLGSYAPRGKGPFPPVTTPLALPAVPAGVPRVAARTPPTPDKSADTATPPPARPRRADTTHKTNPARPSPGPARAN